ncbi:MAG: biotin--[acetyl-CoA-carboxylase] ligase [Rhizobiaceae bacterium]|nr:biotin--[acetyl-CoA-carboxylase] ligase [Rhizobiaceae bacterium]
MSLADIKLPKNYRHIELATTPSTNTECLELAEAGDVGKLWITSKVQTAARGSRGRDWQSEEGNLFASLLLINPAKDADPVTLSSLTFVVSLALLKAINMVPHQGELRLKWPNDVLVNKKKCAGILLENHTIDGKTAVIIGIGVNCNSHPSNTVTPAGDLHHEGIHISANQLFLHLAQQMDELLNKWDEGRRFDDIRDEWLKNAIGLGKQITVKIPGQTETSGIFETINENGMLILKQENGIKKQISMADIFI